MNDVTFNIYSLKNMNEDPSNVNCVEGGLSRGELCQALLDRIKGSINDEYIELLNSNLEEFGFHINQAKISSEEQRQQALSDVEEVLYSCEEDELLNSYWSFPGELIFIGENN